MFASFSLALLLAHSFVTAAVPYEYDALTRDTRLFEEYLTEMENDEEEQIADALQETTDDFFPLDEGGSKRDASVTLDTQFVTFKWNDIPYILKDVPRQAWFAPYVRDMADRGIVTGYKDAYGRPSGIFGPERSVSIEELAKMVLLTAGVDTEKCGGNPMKNQSAQGSWSAKFISCAEQKNMVMYSDGTIDVKRPALRSEVVVTVLEAFNINPPMLIGSGGSLTASGTIITGTSFTDVFPTMQFASYIEAAYANGIIAGYVDAQGQRTGTFGPDRTINRAEVSKVLNLAMQIYGNR